ncbi:hemolysin family protein [Herbaspirillum sp. RTI4]|uniref:hemolysin family protein n=1 Tax=Herbaspirillum sp. RTI4 TaxID=3048640 RepID=UPI002AB5AAF3|nr:hemolysin family protein [Herbaspirillum sp. RTI4]MDY7579606.1 hemolysin family protein [Herbaspirillum sp. RTI4]MEA9981765.1 hemolysin family protein [Herbaspirillum sp. RTI4]
MENLLLIVIALLLVALNGFFVAAEFGLVKLRQTRIQAIAKTQGLRGRILLRVHHQLDAYLSACQLGITLASLGLGWIGEPAFASLLQPLLAMLGIASPELVHGISFAFAFLVISFLHIVIGELAPKSVAIRHPEAIGLWSALPLYCFYWGTYPLIWVLNSSANWVLRRAGLSATHGHEMNYSADELKLILRTGHQGGNFTDDEWRVFAQSLDFGDLSVAELMRPANELIALSDAADLKENLQKISRYRFSRYPYISQSTGVVLGMIHLKDLFIAQQEGKELAGLEKYLRPVQIIAPGLSALELFRRFRSGSPHFAIIGKADQPALGFITFDNMLGALVGEIRDEFLHTENEWMRQDDGTFLGKGSLSIFSLERMLGIDVTGDESVESVGGLVMEKLGDLPKEGQRVEFDSFDIVVKRMKGPRILLVKVYPKQAALELD